MPSGAEKRSHSNNMLNPWGVTEEMHDRLEKADLITTAIFTFWSTEVEVSWGNYNMKKYRCNTLPQQPRSWKFCVNWSSKQTVTISIQPKVFKNIGQSFWVAYTKPWFQFSSDKHWLSQLHQFWLKEWPKYRASY